MLHILSSHGIYLYHQIELIIELEIDFVIKNEKSILVLFGKTNLSDESSDETPSTYAVPLLVLRRMNRKPIQLDIATEKC